MLGEMARVEQYLGRFPGVEFESDDVRELIRAEYIGRLFQGHDDPCESYIERFPGVFDQELLDNLPICAPTRRMTRTSRAIVSSVLTAVAG